MAYKTLCGLCPKTTNIHTFRQSCSGRRFSRIVRRRSSLLLHLVDCSKSSRFFAKRNFFERLVDFSLWISLDDVPSLLPCLVWRMYLGEHQLVLLIFWTQVSCLHAFFGKRAWASLRQRGVLYKIDSLFLLLFSLLFFELFLRIAHAWLSTDSISPLQIQVGVELKSYIMSWIRLHWGS